MSILNDYSGFLIDFDGTLIDSEPIYGLAWEDYFSRFPTQPPHTPGLDRSEGFYDWLESRGENQSHAREYLDDLLHLLPEYLERYKEKAGFHADAQWLLSHTKDHPRCLVTAAQRDWVYILGAQHGIPPMFENFITREDVLPFGEEKPHPRPYRMGAEKLGLEPAQCIAFEDSDAGVLSAKAAGCFVVGIKRYPHYDLAQADLVVEDIRDLL